MRDKPFPDGARIAAYLRDSGGKDQDLSIEQQERAISEWCKERGYVLTRVFRDAASSGTSTVGRDAFLEMARHFRDGAPEVGLVFWKFNRIARDFDDAQYWKADLRRRGVTLHALNDQIPDGLDGRFFEAAIDWMNARYSEDLRADIRRGHWHIASQYHAAPISSTPVGYRRIPVNIGKRRDGSKHIVSRYEPDPETAPRVQQAFGMRAAGRSFRDIHDATNLHTTMTSYGRMFRNKIYIGVYELSGREIPGFCEPLIDPPTWDAVQKLNRAWEEHHNKYHPRRINSRYILSGLVECGNCGMPMTSKTSVNRRGTTYYYYRCSSFNTFDSCRNSQRSIPENKLHRAVFDAVRTFVLEPQNLAAIYKRALEKAQNGENSAKRELGQLQNERSKIGAEIGRLVDAIKSAGHSRVLLDELAALEKRQQEIADAMAAVEIRQSERRVELPLLNETQLRELGNAIIDRLEAGNTKMKQTVLRGIVSKITVDYDGEHVIGEVEFYLPPPLESDETAVLPL